MYNIQIMYQYILNLFHSMWRPAIFDFLSKSKIFCKQAQNEFNYQMNWSEPTYLPALKYNQKNKRFLLRELMNQFLRLKLSIRWGIRANVPRCMSATCSLRLSLSTVYLLSKKCYADAFLFLSFFLNII